MSANPEQLIQLLGTIHNEPVIAEILLRLKQELAPEYCYHSIDHTLDVMREVLRLGLHDQLSANDLLLLAIGAAYHDSGFLEGPVGHERRGARLAREALQRHQFLEAQITAVEGMIISTEVMDSPTCPYRKPGTELSTYLLDADVANIGRGDFLAWADLVRREQGESREKFLAKVELFMKTHIFYTTAAKVLLQPQKMANLAMLSELKVVRGA